MSVRHLPGDGPVHRPDPMAEVFIYGADPCNGGLVFVPFAEMSLWAPFFAAAESAGTWGRFTELGGCEADDLREELSFIACYPDFESFATGELNDAAHDAGYCDDLDLVELRATLTEAELRAEYADIPFPLGRGPLDEDEICLGDLYGYEEEGYLRLYCPMRAMEEGVPPIVANTYGEWQDTSCDMEPNLAFRSEDHDAIVACFTRFGCTMIRDDVLLECFWGFTVDVDEVHRRLAAHEDAERALQEAAMAAIGDEEDD